jgi:metal-responsive CopG/Arc/MetJ family transcriptional regulator
MSTETVRLNITLPIAIAKDLNQAAPPRKRSQFIAEAIQQRIARKNKETLEALLAEGYQERRNEALEITKDFESIDLEHWDDY